VLNSLKFCFSVKLLISPSYLNEILAGYSNLGYRFFSFITLSMPCHSFLSWRVSIARSAVILWLSLFSPGHLYFLPPPSLLYLTLWISLGILGCAEHSRNWLLARLLSSLWILPLLLPVTSISLLPHLFSLSLLEPLWVSLTVENFFTINLDVLSSVLYGWKSRGYCKNKTESERQEA